MLLLFLVERRQLDPVAGPLVWTRPVLDSLILVEARPPDTLAEKEPSAESAAGWPCSWDPSVRTGSTSAPQPKVPIIYGVTFGGFGVLVLIDLGHILFTKDLSPYREQRPGVHVGASRRTRLTPP